jgi:hypothetical protein
MRETTCVWRRFDVGGFLDALGLSCFASDWVLI